MFCNPLTRRRRAFAATRHPPRWSKTVAAFIKRRALVEADALDAFCGASGLASFKRPRRYLFVETIPRSPVGKLLRRMLVAGEYEAERAPTAMPKKGKPS